MPQDKSKTGKKRHMFGKALLLLVLLGGFMLADSGWRIVTSEYTLASPRLPEAFDGFRIVQLSDVHGAEFGENNRRLLKKIEQAEPDLIALTGDLIDENTDLAVIDRLLGSLTELAPVYFVSGNHEWGGGDLEGLKALLEKHGVTYLQNSYVLLEREGEQLVLAGVEDPNGWQDMPRPDEVAERIVQEQGERFTVLLGHRNYWVEKYPELPVDLILCGHAHGGLVRLPFLGGLIGTGFDWFPDYVDGAFTSGRYTMIVSRGLGNSAPVPRFLNNPELVAVTLKHQA